MFFPESIRDVPRAHVDPITGPPDALLLILMSIEHASEFATIVISLTDDRCGHGLFKVTDTEDPDAMLGIVDMMVEAAQTSPDVSGLIVASVRPEGGVDIGDLGRWHEADATCADAGIDLVEWFVVGTSIECPRTLCGVAARWAA